MSLPNTIETIPLTMASEGVIRVGGTRVTLDTIVAAFLEGATVEEIAYQYPSLQFANIYAVIGYYLHHRSEVETYLRQRQQQATKIRKENEHRFSPEGVRARLMARRQKQGV